MLLVAALVLGASIGAQPPAASGPAARRTLELPVLVESNGSAAAASAARLAPSDIEATVDGSPIAIRELRAIPPGEWEILVYALVVTAVDADNDGAALLAIVSIATVVVGTTWLQGAFVYAVQDARDGSFDASLGEVFSRVSSSIRSLWRRQARRGGSCSPTVPCTPCRSTRCRAVTENGSPTR